MLALATPAAAATQVFSFTQTAASLGAGPFGTVTVTENAGALDFVFTLADGYRIRKTQNDNHNAFTFSLAGDPAVTIAGLPSGFSTFRLDSGTGVNAPPFPAAMTGIKCLSACGPGWGGGYSGPLSFKVMAGYQLSLNSLVSNLHNSQAIYFTSHMVNANGVTGNVGAIALSGPVPEPSTWALLILGFGAVGAGMRRRTTARVAYA